MLEGEKVREQLAARKIPDFGPGTVLEVKLVSLPTPDPAAHSLLQCGLPGDACVVPWQELHQDRLRFHLVI